MDERKSTVEYHLHTGDGITCIQVMVKGKGGDEKTERSSIHNKK